MDLNIIYEDKYIIVVEKPSGIPSQKDRSRIKDMASIVMEYLSISNNNSYVGLIHRLDRPVGGLMVFAKNKFANSNLSRQLQNKLIKKKYLAVVCGKPDKVKGTLIDYLVKQNNNMSIVASKNHSKSKEAILHYELLETINHEIEKELSLLKIELVTGRHHQIRVQLSYNSLPIWGDTKYNEKFRNRGGWYKIALYAYKLEFLHPKTSKKLEFESYTKQFPYDCFMQ